jgi:hypothetical protein
MRVLFDCVLKKTSEIIINDKIDKKDRKMNRLIFCLKNDPGNIMELINDDIISTAMSGIATEIKL